MERSWCRWILKNKFLPIKRAGAGFLSVERDNEPSIKTIIKNGGVYERSFEFEGEQADVYKINL